MPSRLSLYCYSRMCIYINIYSYMCIFINIYSRMCVYINIHSRICVYINIYSRTRVYINIYSHMCVYINIDSACVPPDCLQRTTRLLAECPHSIISLPPSAVRLSLLCSENVSGTSLLRNTSFSTLLRVESHKITTIYNQLFINQHVSFKCLSPQV